MGSDGVTRLEGEGGLVLRLVSTRRIEYDVVNVATPLLDRRNETLAAHVRGRPTLVVIDENVDRLYGVALRAYLGHYASEVATVSIPSGEVNKESEQVSRICEHASNRAFPRNGVFVAVGGGVTLDIAGFAASVYRRGIGYLRLPTTLVAIVDVGVGIKQAVNFAGKKSLLGSFYPHEATLCDLRFLETLPKEEVSAGLAEVIKMGMVKSAHLLDLVDDHGAELVRSRFQSPPGVAQEMVALAQELMMEELQPNLYETDLSRLVDFGHTFSPHIEATNGFRGSHGQAVAVDMLLTVAVGVEQGLCEASLLTRLQRMLEVVDLAATVPPNDPAALLAASVEGAQRHRGGNLNLVMPTAVGKATFVQHVEEEAFLRAWDWVEGRVRSEP